MSDTIPEHTKRSRGRQREDGTHPDILAAYAYVDSVCHTANLPGPAWHGWAIREAFLAGISHAAASPAADVSAAFGSAPDLPEPCAVCSEALCECEVCLGDGHIESGVMHEDGYELCEPCAACNGTGRAGGGGHE